MSAFTFSPALIRNCRRCSRELAPGALVCQNCQALVYADEIDRLASQAKRLESKGDLLQARYLWLNALPLMPPDSEQATWIREHARLLEERAAAPQAPSQHASATRHIAFGALRYRPANPHPRRISMMLYSLRIHCFCLLARL